LSVPLAVAASPTPSAELVAMAMSSFEDLSESVDVGLRHR
jgi:hypothetical protein